MKKFWMMMAALVTMLSICVSASATTFTRLVKCDDENAEYVDTVNSETKSVNSYKIKVRHDANGTSNSYTNHFKAIAVKDRKQKAAKWLKTGGEYPMENARAIITGTAYYLKMRGNTNYNTYEGLEEFVISGYFKVN